MRSKLTRLFGKAWVMLSPRRGLLTFPFRVVLPTMIKKLLREGPAGCWRYLSMLLQKFQYRSACKRHAATSTDAEIHLVRPDIPPPPLQEEDLSRLSVLFVTAIDVQASKRYRVDNICEQLRKRGMKTGILYEVDIFKRFEEALTYDVIVFQLMPLDAGIRYLLERASARGIALVFEIDDYVFDTSVYLNQDSVKQASPAYRLYIEGLSRRLHQTMMACQYFISTTWTLADAAKSMGRISYVIRNGLNDQQVALAEQALQRKSQRSGDGRVRIGYQPGTRTHRQDFAVALPALTRILEEFPQVTLVIQGLLDLPDTLRPYRRRIERWPYVSWQKLVEVTGRLDIVIAPLEPDNLLNEAKSALKYFEPGLVEVPVVASPTEDFRTAIHHGVNGFLAATDEEWYQSLRSLVSDPTRRRQIAQAAREDVLAHYTSEAQSTDTLAVFQNILRNQKGLADARRMARQPSYLA